MGRVHMTVYSPSGTQVVGFMISQPDIAGMVKRPDRFLAWDAFTLTDEGLVVSQNKGSFDAAAQERLGLDWDSCIMWTGMDAQTTDGKDLGYIDDVSYNESTGAVQSFYVGDGGVARKLVGTVEIPVSLLRGYQSGHMLVDPEAAHLSLAGGLAAKAGEDYARAKEAGKEGVKKAQKAAGEAVDKGTHEIGRALGRTAEALSETKKEYEKAAGTKTRKKTSSSSNAAKAAGRQLGKMGSMFGSFMDEYKKASK